MATQPPPTTATPTDYDSFRLIPSGYTRPLYLQRLNCPSAAPTTPYTNTSASAIVQQSSLFKQPTTLPSGYRLTQLRGGGFGDAEQAVDLYYEGPGNPIEITITRLTSMPVDLDLPPSDGSYPFVVDQAQVAGVPAIVDHQAFPLDDDVHVQFVRGGVLYKLAGRAQTLGDVPSVIQQLVQMAESLH